jgi:hypothetical protein
MAKKRLRNLVSKKRPRKEAHTYNEYFPELGRELIRMLKLLPSGSYKTAEPKFEKYAKPEYGHLLPPEERLKLLNYIRWSLAPRKRGGQKLLPSEKFRRVQAFRDPFERKKAEFAAAGEKAPREKAIEYFMNEWAVDRSTVEKRIKGRKPPVEDALIYSEDDVPF